MATVRDLRRRFAERATEIRSFVAEQLGDSSYLVLVLEAGLVAAIDPMRDVDQYLEVVEAS